MSDDVSNVIGQMRSRIVERVTISNGWAEVYSIDPSIVSSASALIPSAASYLAQLPAQTKTP